GLRQGPVEPVQGSEVDRDRGQDSAERGDQGQPRRTAGSKRRMKTALYEDGGVRIHDLPIPEPKSDEALVHITAAGVCHSDLHLAKGDWAAVGAVSLIGHEAIGVVESVGTE